MVTKYKLKKDTSSFFTCFLQVVFILLNILKLIVLWLGGKKSRWRCRFILFKLVYHVSIVAKRNAERMVFHHMLGNLPRILHLSVMPVMHYGNPMDIQRSHGIPWVAHGLRLLLVNHFVASLWQPVGPVHLILFGGRDVSVKNWHIGITFKTSFICLEVIKSGSVHRCEVFNGWRGKSRSVELEGRDLVSTEECTAKDFPVFLRLWSGLWNAATATIHRIPLCNGFALELNTIHSGNCSLTKFFSVPVLRHFPVSQSINSFNMQSFDSTEETQDSLVFRSSLSPRLGAFWIITWLIAKVDVHPQNLVERTFAILVLIFGLVLFSSKAQCEAFFQSISLTGFSSTAPSTVFFTAERDRLSKVDFSLRDMLTCSVSREGPFWAFR